MIPKSVTAGLRTLARPPCRSVFVARQLPRRTGRIPADDRERARKKYDIASRKPDATAVCHAVSAGSVTFAIAVTVVVEPVLVIVAIVAVDRHRDAADQPAKIEYRAFAVIRLRRDAPRQWKQQVQDEDKPGSVHRRLRLSQAA